MNTRFKSVMIIDDNNIDLYIASKVIVKNHFAQHILTYTSAVEALQYLQDHLKEPSELPQIILVDIYMPVMSGFEFMLAFDRLPDVVKRHCKAYIVSSTIDENDIARTRNDRNIMAFHEKPITVDFLDKIKAA